MKELSITNDGEDIFVTCPHCKNCEQHPIDEQRHHLQAFAMLEWLEEQKELERSHMACISCKEEFVSVWDCTKLEVQEN